ncbi:MAG: 30S ribosomal protein S9 [Candidatus Omnitrophica bacterium ADurb.Bin292]|jgi:small subunit ribosomal protein S9|nr:MAG: 30S ribosomal protein S9 [Candidatus Omnitrophica bacterium ADurb.Bin292]HOG24524.1 30S ribosomal protein S9 [Candidatus Omnitrophota bacterium]HPW76657.1 30S ribosomal protein S9 [Candidatus Omnitrophota bacterium]HQB11639.1 30S ribosomal protein S9 [Candidatus Omnitrophota bacterium]
MATTSIYATGRRKSAIARVWLFPGQKGFTVNGQASDKYLKRANLQMIVEQPLKAMNLLGQVRVRARVEGGGTAGQAGAIRLGIARALLGLNAESRSPLRRGGYLTRDPREKERKKAGRKGARRRFQYTKR